MNFAHCFHLKELYSYCLSVILLWQPPAKMDVDSSSEEESSDEEPQKKKVIFYYMPNAHQNSVFLHLRLLNNCLIL